MMAQPLAASRIKAIDGLMRSIQSIGEMRMDVDLQVQAFPRWRRTPHDWRCRAQDGDVDPALCEIVRGGAPH